jgi:uncharacterized protein (TIGR02996 family)
MERLPILSEPEAGAFLRAIKDTPGDDTPRLAFADWLQERGDPRGEMIRWSCVIARTPHGTPEWDALHARLRPWAEGGDMLRAWVPDDGYPRLKVEGVHRGLLHLDVGEDADATRDLYPNVFAAVDQGWVETAYFHGPVHRILDDDWKQEFRHALAAVGATWFVYTGREGVPDWYDGEEPWSDDWELDRARELPNLSGVGAMTGTYTDKALAHLSGHPGLRELYLSGEFTPAGLAHLVTLSALEVADVAWFRGVQPGDGGTLAGLTRVRELNIGLENLDDEGFLAFGAMPWLEELLCYVPNRVTPEAIRALREALPNCRLRNRG